MSFIKSRKARYAKHVAGVLILALLSWFTGFPFAFHNVEASGLSSISVTASSSVPLANSNYLVQYTPTSTVASTQTIVIQWSVGNSGGSDEYDLSNLVGADATSTDLTIITSACGGSVADEVSINGGISNTSGARTVTFTACGTISTSTKHIYFINDHIVNPSTPGSYRVSIGGTQPDSGSAMVAILNEVTVSAGVDQTLQFTIQGVSSGGTVNGESISTTTTATAIGYGYLNPLTPVVAAQDLSVTTNATQGFVVTVHEDADLTSSAGGVIYLFDQGARTSTPIDWATPTPVLGNPGTYGHIGLTSDDADLNSGEFVGTKWAGDFYSTTTRTIFSNNGPADGTTQNVGKARVGYKIEITGLQPAGSDYTNHLIYVCTPTF